MKRSSVSAASWPAPPDADLDLGVEPLRGRPVVAFQMNHNFRFRGVRFDERGEPLHHMPQEVGLAGDLVCRFFRDQFAVARTYSV